MIRLPQPPKVLVISFIANIRSKDRAQKLASWKEYFNEVRSIFHSMYSIDSDIFARMFNKRKEEKKPKLSFVDCNKFLAMNISKSLLKAGFHPDKFKNIIRESTKNSATILQSLTNMSNLSANMNINTAEEMAKAAETLDANVTKKMQTVKELFDKIPYIEYESNKNVDDFVAQGDKVMNECP